MPDAAYVTIPLRRLDGTIRAHAIIDACDAHLAAYRWSLSTYGYAKRTLPMSGGKRPLIYLHRGVLGLVPGDGILCDHIDRDKLNCRRSNLRVVTLAQNKQNWPSQAGSSSRYRGVSWQARTQKWKAAAQLNGVQYYLGLFGDEQEAAVVARAWRLNHMPYTVEDSRP